METFEKCKIFFIYYFWNVRGYKAALRGGNYEVKVVLIILPVRVAHKE